MSKTILITRPNSDSALDFLFHWSEKVVNDSRKRGFNVLDLKADKANKKNVESYIKKNKPKLIFFNGHGAKDRIKGNNGEILVLAGSNDHILSDAVVYARSCDSAALLGPKSVKKGSLAFIGYIRKFIFYRSDGYSRNQLNDPIAKLFLEPSNLVVHTLIKGKTAMAAYQKSQKTMIKNYKKMVSSNSTYEEKATAQYLYNNIVSQKLIGDANSSV